MGGGKASQVCERKTGRGRTKVARERKRVNVSGVDKL